MGKINMTKGQTMVYKSLQRKQKSNPVLSSSVTYHRLFHKSNTMTPLVEQELSTLSEVFGGVALLLSL
jgi:hypothetical protein